MQAAGFANVEMIPVSADGKTVFDDHIMALAWDAEYGRLEVVSCPVNSDAAVFSE